jgi:organic hydroperoxide reductase OsmC/OhrA
VVVSAYSATIHWRRNGDDFAGNKYSRAHDWIFDGGLTVAASASPHIVPLPHSVAENVDPEEAFVASLASCHMLFFLSFAREEGIVVEDYRDEAVGYLEKGADGKWWMSRVVLRPQAEYAAEAAPDESTLAALHHRAHEQCFIASSVKSAVTTEIVS